MTKISETLSPIHSNTRFLTRPTIAIVTAFALMQLTHRLAAAQAPINLGTAGNYAILAESGISSVPASAITGDIGVSPDDSTAITGFSLILTAASPFSTCSQVTGKVYAPDYADPTAINLTTAIENMLTAYDEAAGRPTPDFTELGSGEIGGKNLVPGLYKWGTDVKITTDVTLTGSATDVWVLQIAGKLTEANGAKVILAGGALAKNIFWQSFGVVAIGTGSHFEGTILSHTAITLATGASINGKLLAQTAVTLDSSTVTDSNSSTTPILVSSAVVTGPYLGAGGQSLNLATKTITVPKSGKTQFYRMRSGTALTITSTTTSGNNIIITYN
ncbi:MAG: hypothetical protein JWM68_4881 [Verrucomicrobiales bacterium]|nr:hypothetical protein [Verrucomicrobiales bacterium]